MNPIADTPAPPYYAAIFTSQQSGHDVVGYEQTAQRMVELAKMQPGFLGVESVRDSNGVGITVSYWESVEAIKIWHDHTEHRIAQVKGKAQWYAFYQLRICKIETAYGRS